ncbi:hypothetical protein OAK96_04450 [Pseudomonadota bacterium]|jgi:hypothetical protein|nr:hypothetical protein [Pseudomonadota bacterium]MDC0914247.1 hypothetical protein [Gammaproteobacteria bacterium]|tara:strand:- start:26 stop:430 length:405 start_codon:yes stop_codon:yes gene_type:complete
MNINYFFIKKTLIGLVSILAGYVLYLLILSFVSRPDEMNIDFSPIEGSAQLSSSIEVSQLESSPSSNFDYKVVGFRASSSRASVIVKRNNQTFVVQQGALLENKYKLASVDSEYATFEYNGNIFQLSTNLTVDN